MEMNHSRMKISYSRIRMDLVVNTLSAKAFFEKKMSVFGGDQFRPILHVKDVARAIEIGIRSKKKGVYNLSLKNMRKRLAIKLGVGHCLSLN